MLKSLSYSEGRIMDGTFMATVFFDLSHKVPAWHDSSFSSTVVNSFGIKLSGISISAKYMFDGITDLSQCTRVSHMQILREDEVYKALYPFSFHRPPYSLAP